MVYAKLDWFSCMFRNRSLHDLFKLLHLPDDYYSDIIGCGFERSLGFASKFVYSLRGISFEFSLNDKFNCEESRLFDTLFADVRLDISGQGLDYLRQYLPVDTVFCSPSFFGDVQSYAITRADFAFDFVNYQGSFPYELIDYMHQYKTAYPGERLRTGRSSGIGNFDYHKSTAYMGAPSSEQRLVVYDKKLEQTKNGVFKSNVYGFQKEDKTVDTWFRVELRARRKTATKCLFGCDGDLFNVLRFVFDTYKVYDDAGQVLKSIENLYKWDEVLGIRGNFDFIQLAPVSVQCRNYVFGQSFSSLIITLALQSPASFIDDINVSLAQNALTFLPSYIRRYNGINFKLNTMAKEEGLDIHKLPNLEFIQFDGIEIPFIKGGSLSFPLILKKLYSEV